MTMFIILAILFGVLIGSFFGFMFSVNMKGFKKVFVIILTMVITGCLISTMFCSEYNSDEEKWNNGYCECGEKWVFSNAVHTRNGGTIYYWHCEKCNKTIELHSQF